MNLSDERATARMAGIPAWVREGDTLVRTFEMPSFKAAMELVQRIADQVLQANRYPDILIRHGNVTITLSAHDARRLTEQDFSLAETLERLLSH